ncbi:uncharacterized protein PAC_01132 [Phialocephala subalpina]|uniref:Uncharacterized protein n=1 Tax=Phialocephala subalpina TaxID=576137 RepID=A0A1L7WEQ4_9HELO|nr:uncharacterized protein PAC_01132 [Phialocephala subalpina]
MFPIAILLTIALLFNPALALPAVNSADQTSAPLSYPTSPLGYMNFSDYATLMETRDLSKRQPGGVFITTDINWGGTTGYAKQPFDLCIQLNDPWYISPLSSSLRLQSLNLH